MQRENGRRQPGPRDFQLLQHLHQQQRRKSVQQNVHQMITRRPISPKPVFHPKDTVDQWIVLLRGAKLCPDPRQPIQRTKFRPGNVRVIVPDESGLPGRLVGEEDSGNQQQTLQPAPLPQTTQPPQTPFDADGEAVIQFPSNWPNSGLAATANAIQNGVK